MITVFDQDEVWEDYIASDRREQAEKNAKEVRKMVMDSYQDMLDGKGRMYKEFFQELESRYKNAMPIMSNKGV